MGDLKGKFPIKTERKITSGKSQILTRFVNKRTVSTGQYDNSGILFLFILRAFYYQLKYHLMVLNKN